MEASRRGAVPWMYVQVAFLIFIYVAFSLPYFNALLGGVWWPPPTLLRGVHPMAAQSILKVPARAPACQELKPPLAPLARHSLITPAHCGSAAGAPDRIAGTLCRHGHQPGRVRRVPLLHPGRPSPLRVRRRRP